TDVERLLRMPRRAAGRRARHGEGDVLERSERRRALLVERAGPVRDDVQPRAGTGQRLPGVRGPRALWPELSVDRAHVVHQMLWRDVDDETETADALDVAGARVPRVDDAETAIASRVVPYRGLVPVEQQSVRAIT